MLIEPERVIWLSLSWDNHCNNIGYYADRPSVAQCIKKGQAHTTQPSVPFKIKCHKTKFCLCSSAGFSTCPSHKLTMRKAPRIFFCNGSYTFPFIVFSLPLMCTEASTHQPLYSKATKTKKDGFGAMWVHLSRLTYHYYNDNMYICQPTTHIPLYGKL